MGLDITFYPVHPRFFENDVIDVRTYIPCERSVELYFQIDAYGFPPEDPEQTHIPYAVVKPKPMPEGKHVHLEEGTFDSDRIGEWDEHKFVYLLAGDFHEINAEIIEHHVARAAVHFMRALPKDWPVIMWRG